MQHSSPAQKKMAHKSFSIDALMAKEPEPAEKRDPSPRLLGSDGSDCRKATESSAAERQLAALRAAAHSIVKPTPYSPSLPGLASLPGLSPAWPLPHLSPPMHSLTSGLSPELEFMSRSHVLHPLCHVSREQLNPWLLRAGAVMPRLPAASGDFPGFFFPPYRKPKRIRTAFTPNQLLQLEQAFEKNHYVVGQERKQLAVALNLTETQVKVWFQNRRTKHKRVRSDGDSPGSSPSRLQDDVMDADDVTEMFEEEEDEEEELDVDAVDTCVFPMQQPVPSSLASVTSSHATGVASAPS